MDYDFWDNCWARPTQPFHLTAPHHFLVNYFSRHVAQHSRALLPLCGKTQDLNFLAQQGVSAIGVEFNPVAVESFFSDSGIQPQVIKSGTSTRYRSERIDVWCGDFFELSKEDLGEFAIIFDRAALVALPDDLRPSYAQHLASFLSPGGNILLVTMDYDTEEMSGPPFFVSKQELQQLFPQASIQELDRISILDSHPRWRELELSRLDEVLYEIHIN